MFENIKNTLSSIFENILYEWEIVVRCLKKVFVDIMPGSYTIKTKMREGNAG